MKHKLTTKTIFLLSITNLLLLVGCSTDIQKVSTETLLKEMVDKRAVTYFPEHYYTTKQFSSYDRASAKGDPTDYSWFANMDCSFFIGQDTIGDRIENILYDAVGPGSVTRIWFTGGGPGLEDGIIRFYLDGAKEPVIKGKVFELFGDNKEIGYPLNAILNRGHNSYLPIPYAKHCKVTYESKFVNDSTKSQMFYYNINYRTYEENTIVESFTANTLDSLQTQIKETNKALLLPDNFAKLNKTATERLSASLKPAQTESKIIEAQNSALSEITINLKAEDMEQALRSTVLKITFDGNQTVWCPVGDFFATGHIWRESKTWSTVVDPKSHTLTANWVMPFERTCEVSFENLGTQPVLLDVELTQCDYKWNNRSSMYFGSSWHQYTQISTGENKERMGKGGIVDLNYINLQGKGVFVGDALSIYNPALAGHWKTWWGEGDEKIYVDGETFPSHFGTGTEDYYGYAWCIAASFFHPFVAQPIGEGNLTPGYTVNSRFRALDVIPFKSSFRLDMELWHWVKTKVNYAPTTFYYMLPGGCSDREIDVKGAKEKIARDRFDVLTNKPDTDGLLEGEDLRIADSIASQLNGYYSDNVSGGLALQWHQAKQGRVLDATFGVTEAGTYEVIVGVLKEPKFATISLALNGQRVVSSFTCDAKAFRVEEISLGKHKLLTADNKLSINVNQEKSGRVGIDYIRIVK